MAFRAHAYIMGLGTERLSAIAFSLNSTAIDGNRLGEICSETLRRVMVGEPVSDRYVLGLAWMIREMETQA